MGLLAFVATLIETRQFRRVFLRFSYIDKLNNGMLALHIVELLYNEIKES